MTDGVTMAVIGVYQTVHTSGKHKKTRQKVNNCVKKLVRQVEKDYEDPIIAVMGDLNDAMDRDKYLRRKRISRESIQHGKPPDEVVDWLLGQEFESPHMEDSSHTHQYTRRPTGGAVGARSTIDYIFLNPAGLRRVVKCGIDRTVCRRVCSSDHDLLYVDLLLKAPQGKRMQQTRGAVMYNMLTEIPMKRKKTKKTQEDDDMDGEEDDGRMFEIDDRDLTKKELEEYTKRLEEMAKTEKGDDIVRSRRTILNEAKELLQTFAHRVTREGGNDWDYDKGELPKRNAKECEDLDKLMERFTKLIEKVMKKQMWVSKENPRAKADREREMSKAGDLAARRIIGKKSTMKLLIAALEDCRSCKSATAWRKNQVERVGKLDDEDPTKPIKLAEVEKNQEKHMTSVEESVMNILEEAKAERRNMKRQVEDREVTKTTDKWSKTSVRKQMFGELDDEVAKESTLR